VITLSRYVNTFTPGAFYIETSALANEGKCALLLFMCVCPSAARRLQSARAYHALCYVCRWSCVACRVRWCVCVCACRS
jgi:hypothetical protein